MATNNDNITKTEMASLSLDVGRLKEEIGNVFGDDEKSKGKFISEIEAFIKDPRIETKRSGIGRLEQILSSNKNLGNNTYVQMTAKKFYLTVDKIIEQHAGEVKALREETFGKNFDKELVEKNPSLNETKLKSAGEYRDLVSKNSFDKSIIDGQQNIALENNDPVFGPGKLENAWMDLKTTVNFLQKSPEEIKGIKEKYNSLKGKLDGVNLPTGSKEARSFDRVMSVLNNPNADDLFSKTRKYLGWADRVDKLTGGWLNKTVTEAGIKVFEKIGNQAIQEFATNALGQMAEHGFQQGFSNVLNGILSGGVKKGVEFGVEKGAEMGAKVAVQTGAKIAVKVGAELGAEAAVGTVGGAATGGILTIAMIALEALKAIKKTGNAIAEKLGISSKKFLEDTFGKAGGFLVKGAISMVAVPMALLGAITATTVGPIIIAVMVGLFGYQIFLSSMVSSLNPPKGATNTTSTTVEIPAAAGGNNSTGKYPSASTYEYLGQLGTVINQYGVSLPIFEKEGGSLVTTFYDIGKIENGIWLEKFPNGGNCLLDKRMIPVYLAMVAQAGKEGVSENYFALTSDCYRSYELQKSIYDPSLAKGRTIAKNQGIDISDWTDFEIAKLGHGGVGLASPGHSAHMTGRAVDATNLGSKGLNWMKTNGWKFGFYKNSKEDWHWEYNPSS